MKRSAWTLVLAVAVLAVGGATPGCSCNHDNGGTGDGGAGGGGTGGGAGGGGGVNICGDNDPGCASSCLGPTCMPPNMFPLPSDMPPDPNVGADGVDRDSNGWIVLNQGKANFNYIWIADDQNYNVGMVSKIDTRKSTAAGGAVNHDYREVARYLTVTCESNEKASWRDHSGQTLGPSGVMTANNCDGTNGCCGRGPTGGGRTPIQLTYNHPSRTAVDFNGDAWVANRAHIENPHQSSVTKIANKNNSITDTDCIDRNGNGKIETSFDANGDGIINTDCNGNAVPDSVADVAATACKVGTPQEFWGLDDECVLFTTNTGAPGGTGRPLALGQGSTDFAPSDAWAGRFADSVWYRVDGTTGLIKATVKINDQGGIKSNPYGAAIDQGGILWAPNIDNHTLFYFDTNNPTNQAAVTPPFTTGGTGFYGVAIDGYKAPPAGCGPPQLVQQVWLAHYGGVGGFRYTPKRSAQFTDLALGQFTMFTFTGAPAGNGRGVGVDNRNPTSFAWFALDANGSANQGSVGRVAVDYMLGTQTVNVANAFFPNMHTTTLGAGVAADLDIWAINQGDSTAVHYSVDATGNVTTPTGADLVKLDDNGLTTGATAHQPPYPYTYSDFTGFGLRNFTNPHGSYSYIWTGCGVAKTKWLKIIWDAATPPGTAISVKVRSSDDKSTISSATFTGSYMTSPADLQNAPGPVMPNPSGFLQVEFDLTTTDKNSTPALKSYTVVYECINGIG